MPYLLAAIFVASTGLGYWAEHQISRTQIEHMELALQSQKVEAQTLLATATVRITKSEADARNANQQLEKSHETAINSINSLHDSFANERMRDPGRRPSRGCPVPASASAGQPEDQTDGSELSAELAGFLVDQSYRADQVAAYAATCYRFVSNNCGIAKD
ncbi:MAG: hypothetical protein ACXV8Q_00540 [Methylobacter sp.]